MLVTVGGWQARVEAGVAAWTSAGAATLRAAVPATAPPLPAPREVTVESGRLGCPSQYAALAARLDPDPASGSLTVEVPDTGPDAAGTAAARQWDPRYDVPLAGLPAPYAAATLRALVAAAESMPAPPGRLTVAGARYHVVDSSEYAFARCARLLYLALVADDPETAIRETMTAWRTQT